ncbi:hypothetical protein HBHAL_3453 [Halobacillus halophilus DSM 2266]|uniref:Uncharacterized protein n=1 Tax=Halobacillus halophilus (strain ATCC 35676 / DSM 2266 / JCM 20832 / KCTC 3685 / LMG 17431 / NBRC 102448 / NCIMB 2269) TaxID=866895 RepID=I0JNS7_HALH3|nr:hypothetical protein HBHAL_3453 [Halobacillus halophilus DSM 2266]
MFIWEQLLSYIRTTFDRVNSIGLKDDEYLGKMTLVLNKGAMLHGF